MVAWLTCLLYGAMIGYWNDQALLVPWLSLATQCTVPWLDVKNPTHSEFTMIAWLAVVKPTHRRLTMIAWSAVTNLTHSKYTEYWSLNKYLEAIGFAYIISTRTDIWHGCDLLRLKRDCFSWSRSCSHVWCVCFHLALIGVSMTWMVWKVN